MVLQMAAQQFPGQLDPLRMGVARRHRAGIDGIQVAPRRQHICPPPVRRPGRARVNPPAVERRPQACHLARTGPIHMQPVAELAFLDVADKAVNPGDRLGGTGIGGQAKVGGQT